MLLFCYMRQFDYVATILADPAPDGVLDHQVGLLCNDGLFEEPTGDAWPDESSCVQEPVCTSPHEPDTELARFLPLDAPSEVPDGDAVVYQCEDPEAVLSDGSGLTAYTVW